MRTIGRLAALGLAVGVGLAAADPTPTTPPVTAAVSLDWSGPATVRRGRPNAFTLTVTNTGRVAAQRVTVQVRPPDDATVADAAPAARAEAGVLVWELGTLEPGQARPLSLTLVAGQRGELSCPAWVTFTGGAGLAVRVQEPKLDITLKAPETVAVGDRFEVTADITNTGDAALEGVDVRRTIPNPLPVQLGDAGVATAIDTTTEACGRFVSGQVWATRYAGVAHTPGELVYAVTARGRGDDGVRAEATARVRVIAPKLTATVAGPDKLLVGRTGTYTLTVRNAGELAVEDATPVVPVPAGLRASAATDGKLSWSLGTLKPGEERRVTFDAVATAVGVQPVAVTVTGSRGATAAAECRTAVDGVPALRVELLDTADPVEAGKETTYEVRVTNTGTKADENVTVVCELPAALEAVSATGPTESAPVRIGANFGKPLPPGNPTVSTVGFDPIRELAPKTEAVFRVKVKAATVGDVRFKATVTSKHLTAPVVKEESTRVYAD